MLNEESIYYTTATIYEWIHLLQQDIFKDILISSLKFLNETDRLYIFAFVIMPNHIHIVWSINQNTGNETGYASFFKFTSNHFLKKLKKNDPVLLQKFLVRKKDRKHQFWKRNSLSIEILSDEMFEQKLNYIHNNPLQPQWDLVNNPTDYRYSSARYYEEGVDEFGILTNYYLS
ncbi:MAG: transposase [Chlorobi bacterium]|nr:transposase [Chlorobiota bacterium]